jgi:hypothetical protein
MTQDLSDIISAALKAAPTRALLKELSARLERAEHLDAQTEPRTVRKRRARRRGRKSGAAASPAVRVRRRRRASSARARPTEAASAPARSARAADDIDIRTAASRPAASSGNGSIAAPSRTQLMAGR